MSEIRVEEIYRDKIYPVEPKPWLDEYTRDHVDFKKFCAQELGNG